MWILFLILGLCVGSFMGVVVYRLPRGLSIISPSSRCGHCKTPLKTLDNIPLLSFLMLRGKCRYCGALIGPRTFWIEMLSGLLWAAVAYRFGESVSSGIFALFCSIWLAIAFIDLELKIIPDALSVGGALVALGLAALNIPQYPISFEQAALGSAVGYFVFWLLSRVYYWWAHEEGLGGGDVKLMAFIGAVLGVKGVAATILFGSLFGCVVGLFLMMVEGRGRKTMIPFGPFLVMGAYLALWGFDAWIWK